MPVLIMYRSCGTRRGRGVIVNVCSSLGISASATGIPFPAYISSKHGKLSRVHDILCSWLMRIYRRDGTYENGFNTHPILIEFTLAD